jgi:hypothetical protein
VSEIVAKRIGSNPLSGVRNLRLHWPKYLIEAGERLRYRHLLVRQMVSDEESDLGPIDGNRREPQ